MNENKTEVKGFFLYLDQHTPIAGLTFEQKGMLLDAFFAWHSGQDVDIPDPVARMAFAFFQQQFERDLQRREELVEKNRENGKKGGRPPKNPTVIYENPKNPTVISETQPNPKKPKHEYKHEHDIYNTTLRVVVDNVPVADASPAETAVEAQKPSGPPPCPHREIIAAYHELLPTLSRVKAWEGTRPKNLQARWRSCWERGKYANSAEGITYWRRLFQYVHDRCPFLMGETQSRDGKTWKADLDWLIQSKNFVKVIEGKYDAGAEA